MNKKFLIFANTDEVSVKITQEVTSKMEASGWSITEDDGSADLIFCIGGDGALLRLLRRYKFPEAPIVGINTGHLGFFQEISVDGIDEFMEMLQKGDYHIQEYIGISADIHTENEVKNYVAINEIVVRGDGERLIHLDIKIGDRQIARYSGDGVLVCTPAGSTAYNYSLGGVIVDPSVDMLQITPIAPVNNVAYRSITSGIIVPTHTSIELVPVNNEGKKIAVIEDGSIVADGDIRRIDIHVAERKARIVRFSNYSFWGKVKDKIIG